MLRHEVGNPTHDGRTRPLCGGFLSRAQVQDAENSYT